MGLFFKRFIPPAPHFASSLSAVSMISSVTESRLERALSRHFDHLQHTGATGDFEYFLATDRLSGSTVEIKALSEEAAPESREMFSLVCRAASSLSHINILESGKESTCDGIRFCVQEYKADARTLWETLRQEGWFDIAQTVDIADEIASALDYAHHLGVIHLNLHPGNILIEQNGLVYIKGFGVEQSLDSQCARRDRSRRQLSSYLSLEQIASEDADYRSDLYSFGLIVFKMLTDRVPFDSDDAIHITEERARRLTPPPHFFREDLPEAVSEVTLKMLSKKPECRYESASEFVSALRDATQEVRESEPISDEVREETEQALPQAKAASFLHMRSAAVTGKSQIR